MTEAEWLTSTNLSSVKQHLLRFTSGISERKARLFGCACCRRIWHCLTDSNSQKAVEVAELYADGMATPKELGTAREAAKGAAEVRDNMGTVIGRNLAGRAVASCALRNGRDAGWRASDEAATYVACDVYYGTAAETRGPIENWYKAIEDQKSKQIPLLRDMVGNPFRLVIIDPSWLSWQDATLVKIARAIYDERRFADLPVRADALEAAGCTDESILTHCRQPTEHVRGCWVLDLVLNKA